MLSKSIFIVTPSYNASGTIERTIQSIINLQDVDYLRYHIQDGVSSDGTQDIIKKIDTIIKKNPVKYGHIDFSWSSEKDNGMYDAIAKGFQKMSIPDDAFMGWINADDILFPDALKKIFEVITTLQNIQWIGGRHCIIDEDDIIITKGGSNIFYPQFLLKNGCCDGKNWYYIQQEGSFWRKTLWDATGGLNIDLRYAGDWDLWRRMALHAPFIYCPFFTGAFRKRLGQLSSHSGYQDEINLLLPQTKRKKAFLMFLLLSSNKKFKKLKFKKTWVLFDEVPVWPIKEQVRRFLLTFNMRKTEKILRLFYHFWTK